MKSFKFLLLLLLFISCSKHQGNSKSLDYDSVELEFDGLKGDFYRKGNISLSFNDKKIVDKLNSLKNSSKKAPTFATIKPVMFQIDLVYKNSLTKESLLVTLNSNTKNEIVVVIGKDYFLNKELYSYISLLINLDEIRKYKGNLTQEGYDEIISDHSN